MSDPRTFEELLEELERITRQMAAGDIGIEEVADLYERAGQLHAEATARLDRVRERVERLTADQPADGQAQERIQPADGQAQEGIQPADGQV